MVVGCFEDIGITCCDRFYHGIGGEVPIDGPKRTAFRNSRCSAASQLLKVGSLANRITCPLPNDSVVANAVSASLWRASGHIRPLILNWSASASRTPVAMGRLLIKAV